MMMMHQQNQHDDAYEEEEDQFAQRMPPANRLLELSRGKTWRVTDLDEHGDEKHASLLSSSVSTKDVSFEFKIRRGPQQVGQWCFISNPNTQESYTLGWYIGSRLEDPSQHFFGLVSARELCDEINAQTLYRRPDLIALSYAYDTVCIATRAMYDGPLMHDAVSCIAEANRPTHRLMMQSASSFQSRKMREAAQRAAAREEFDVDFSSLSIDSSSSSRRKNDKAQPSGLFVAAPDATAAAEPRRFVSARRSFLTHHF
jgi:hypothetical protein